MQLDQYHQQFRVAIEKHEEMLNKLLGPIEDRSFHADFFKHFTDDELAVLPNRYLHRLSTDVRFDDSIWYNMIFSGRIKFSQIPALPTVRHLGVVLGMRSCIEKRTDYPGSGV